MLFNSFVFIFLFLPVTLLGFFWLGKRYNQQVAISWLVLCSLFFYGWWNPAYLSLIVFSMLFNYAFGVILSGGENKKSRKLLLVFGVTVNLLLLGYYKYANFFIEQVNLIVSTDFHIENILLPLAISFFTFQQIAYLIDAYRGETKEYNFLHYCLFVTFFPQLIAGPIVHHKEMLPQFNKTTIYKFNYEHISIGFTIFTLGLFKKIIFADGIAIHANPIFTLAETGAALTVYDAWGGAISYSLQLYFDFSGYSDMAIGIAYMFGIKLPINFNSPYKANNIIEFWRRWHITLSIFLRDYLYFSLGGNRKGNIRRYVNLLITMILGGLWHGAGWTFIIWGGLHGIYLIINHMWIKLRRNLLKWSCNVSLVEKLISKTLTLLAIIFAWVYFRAETMEGANNMIYAMMGLNSENTLSSLNIFGNGTFWILVLMFITILMPNTFQIVHSNQLNYKSIIIKYPVFSGLISGGILFYVFTKLSAEAEFLYFNF